MEMLSRIGHGEVNGPAVRRFGIASQLSTVAFTKPLRAAKAGQESEFQSCTTH
jgi:hypothetical protein